ncbi:hypothetical protein A7K94_0208960 [Modestobacter sp. VKM Ac-2676]|nr:hypothetical protein A7K94_0208960 [Modestobacter sp. VKM Ac-2676]
MRVLHLSDPHLMAPGDVHHGAVDTLAATRRVLAACAELPTPDLVVVSGDVSDDGTVESYEAARDVIGGWARVRGARAVFAMGNHDQRATFRQVLGDGHLDAPAPRPSTPALPGATCPSTRSPGSGGRRVVTLDSSVPRAGYGRVDAAQLAWLREELRTPAPAGTVLVLHHPPLPPVTRLHTALQLQDPAPLGEVVAASDVLVVLAGHYHHPMSGIFGGRLVVVAPAIANRTDTGCPGAPSAPCAAAGPPWSTSAPSRGRSPPCTWSRHPTTARRSSPTGGGGRADRPARRPRTPRVAAAVTGDRAGRPRR